MSVPELTDTVAQFHAIIGAPLEGRRVTVSPRSSDQDLWLAEAAHALAEAERLTGLLALMQPRNDHELAALQSEIMGVRREIERLKRDRLGEKRREYDPDWMRSSAWTPAS